MVMTDFAELFKKIIQLRLEQEYFQQRKGKKLIDFVGTKWSIRNVDIYIYRTKQEKSKNFHQYSLHNSNIHFGVEHRNTDNKEFTYISFLAFLPIFLCFVYVCLER